MPEDKTKVCGWCDKPVRDCVLMEDLKSQCLVSLCTTCYNAYLGKKSQWPHYRVFRGVRFEVPDPAAQGGAEVREFSTGAKREKSVDEAVRYDLIPLEGIQAVAETAAYGEKKYGVGNWEKGLPAEQMLNHCMNHIIEWLKGDESEPHLEHAAWNACAAITSLQRWPELNKKLLELRQKRADDLSQNE